MYIQNFHKSTPKHSMVTTVEQWRTVWVSEVSAAYSPKKKNQNFIRNVLQKFYQKEAVDDSDHFRYLIFELSTIKHNGMLL